MLTTQTTTKKSSRVLSAVQHLAGATWLMDGKRVKDLIARATAPDFAERAAYEDDGEHPTGADTSYQKLPSGVAVISVVGVLTKYPAWYDKYLGLASTMRLRVSLAEAMADPAVQSIVMLIDTPGGSVAGTTELAEAVAAANRTKPISTIVSDLCASGGYYLASQCSSIYANAHAFIGCIGVYSVLADDSKFWEDLGVDWKLVSTGGVKGLGADGRVSDELIADVQREIDSTYELFIAAIARGRSMSNEQARALADGRSWIAAEAQTRGLIDTVASNDAAIAAVQLETIEMTIEQVREFAKANPDKMNEFTKVARDEGHATGKAEGEQAGRQAERARFDQLSQIRGASPDFCAKQFKAGKSVADAKLELADEVIAQNEQLREQIKNGGKGQQQQQTQQSPPPLELDRNPSEDEFAQARKDGVERGKRLNGEG